MLNIQEQEELDFSPDTAERNAFALSNMEHQWRPASIDEALSQGKFVVIENCIAYCPITDAILRRPNQHLISTHQSREEAIAFVDQYECCEESFMTIEPQLPIVPQLIDYSVSDPNVPF